MDIYTIYKKDTYIWKVHSKVKGLQMALWTASELCIKTPERNILIVNPRGEIL